MPHTPLGAHFTRHHQQDVPSTRHFSVWHYTKSTLVEPTLTLPPVQHPFRIQLDPVLLSQTQLIPSATILPPIANSDYLPVLCKTDKSLKQLDSRRTRRIWCYNKAEPRKLSLELRKSDWRPVSKAENVDAALKALENIFISVVRKHVPSKLIKHVKPKLPWMTPLLEKEIRAKRVLFRKSKRFSLHVDREAFNRQRIK